MAVSDERMGAGAARAGASGFDFAAARVAVVTGGGSGIGRAICLALARRGLDRVVAADVDLAGALETVRAVEALGCGCGARAVQCDVSSKIGVDALIADVTSLDGPVDAFFANAGLMADFGGVEGATLERWEQMMAVHVYQSVHAARALLPDLARRGGCFAVTSSAAGLMSMIGAAAYTTTKHASRAFAEWLSITYGGKGGLHVACLCPQAVESKMTAGFAAADVAVAAGDGVIPAETAAESLCTALQEGRFLALPHAQVGSYMVLKATDPDGWLRGMRAWQARLVAATAAKRGGRSRL